MDEIARTMFGVGALITHPEDQSRFLLLKKSSRNGNFNKEKWELLYGRKAPMEDISAALHREASEELGLTDLRIGQPLRFWHFFRGEAHPDNEIIGMSFVCQTQTLEPQLSSEHSDYRWVTAAEALQLIQVPGIRQDIELYSSKQSRQGLHLTPLDGSLIPLFGYAARRDA